MEKNKIEYEELEVTFEELADLIGIDDLETPELYEIEKLGYEILSADSKTGEEFWKPIQNFIVKSEQNRCYELGELVGTQEHKVWYNGKWTKLSEHPDAIMLNKPTKVVDLTVKDTGTYKCGGQLNHNTTTPGGMALPYAASTRIRITSTGQAQIKDKEKNVIGINVKVKTIKNKVARPFRECAFQIHFGRGIFEHEEVFDLFKNHCKKNGGVVLPNGEKVVVEGEASWKNFVIYSDKGKKLDEVKFHKPDFKEKVLDVPAYGKFVEALYEAALVMKSDDREHTTLTGIDTNNLMEVKAAAMEANQKKKKKKRKRS